MGPISREGLAEATKLDDGVFTKLVLAMRTLFGGGSVHPTTEFLRSLACCSYSSFSRNLEMVGPFLQRYL